MRHDNDFSTKCLSKHNGKVSKTTQSQNSHNAISSNISPFQRSISSSTSTKKCTCAFIGNTIKDFYHKGFVSSVKCTRLVTSIEEEKRKESIRPISSIYLHNRRMSCPHYLFN
jgi:hypothetical protein